MSDRIDQFLRDPAYRKKKTPHGTYAIVTLPDGFGGRRDFMLGKYGSKESRLEYRRRLTEWEAAGRRLPSKAEESEPTINEVGSAFWKHAEQHYRHPDGTPTGELNEYRLSLRPLFVLYGDTLAKDFGPLALKAVRQAMMDGSWLTSDEKAKRQKEGRQTTLCRGVINQRVGRIRRMFRWGVENELVPSSVLHALEAVKGLERGRTAARETEPVKPVSKAYIEATLPYLLPTVADMVMLQLHSGMRPGEMCLMRGIDLDMTGKVWLYRPGSDRGPAGQHKMAYRGHEKVVPLGPRAQEIIRRHLKADVTAHLFSPRDTLREKWERDRRKRKTKIYPCEKSRKQTRPKVQPGERYTPVAYAVAVGRAIKKANKMAQTPIPHWHPHQLRHTKGTEIRKQFGLDAARAVLGHRSPVITEFYAELDAGKAAEVAEKLG